MKCSGRPAQLWAACLSPFAASLGTRFAPIALCLVAFGATFGLLGMARNFAMYLLTMGTAGFFHAGHGYGRYGVDSRSGPVDHAGTGLLHRPDHFC